jgi:hypothetical protein
MPIVRPIFEIDVSKMEHAFQMGYIGRGRRSSLFPPPIGKVKRFLFLLLNIIGVFYGKKITIGLKSSCRGT